MSNVIGFLEGMGRDAQLRHAGADALETAMARVGIDSPLQAAIATRDPLRLEELLGARTDLVCGLSPGRQDNEEPAEPSKQDDDEEVRVAAFRRVAGSR